LKNVQDLTRYVKKITLPLKSNFWNF
jgi:hypothetical protein